MLRGVGDSPQYALDNLEPSRIRAARERTGMTGRDLAEKINKSASAVSQFESGITKPDIETFVRMSMALGVPTTFFAEKELGQAPSFAFDRCHFRARRRVSQRDRRASVREGELLLEVTNFVESMGVCFPAEQISNYQHDAFLRHPEDYESIERLASGLRQHWNMGFGPIPNLVQLLESKGIFVFPLAQAHIDVDAYSVWAANRPCIMLALNKSASRARFDAAHELAHLVLHEDIDPGAGIIERQADRFASAFLAPREGFIAECPRRWSMPVFERLKSRWRLSIAALVRRAYDLGCLSQTSYSRAFRELSQAGLRKKEPGEWTHDRPSLLDQALTLLRSRVDIQSLAQHLTLYEVDVERLMERNITEETLDMIRPRRTHRSANMVFLKTDNLDEL